MSKRTVSRRLILVPRGLNEEEIDSPESEDEMSEVAQVLQRELIVSKNFSSSVETDENDGVEILEMIILIQKRRKEYIGRKNNLWLQCLLMVVNYQNHQ